MNMNHIITLASLATFIICAVFILPIALDRELRRQEIVQQYHCEQYGESIAKWATEKGITNPCTL